MIESKPNGAVGKPSRAWSCVSGYSQDYGWYISHWGVGLSSQNGSPCSWMALGFHRLLSGSHSSHKGMLSTKRCQVIVVERGIQGKGVLFSHLAYIISLRCFLKTYIMHSISISVSKGKKTVQIGRRRILYF